MNKHPIILGGQQGQFGDCIISTVVARAIKERFPNSRYIYGINKKYWEIEPLFKNHPYIDEIIQWEGYDNFPTQKDIDLINQIKPNIFLHPMSTHPNNNYWHLLIERQAQAACIMQGLTPPKNLQCYLNKYFEIHKNNNLVCISPFTAWQKKNISNEKWQNIIDYIINKGYKVIQIGTKDEYKFNNTIKPDLSYFESVKLMLGCLFLITLDGGMCWVSSAYNHPTLGLMGIHYDGLESSKLYQPINTAACYLEAYKAEDIKNEDIFKEIDKFINI